MKVSVITVCFNSASTIADALQSVRAQRLPPDVELEHIVVDGGSTDGTMDIVRAAPGVRYLSERDRGLYDALNKGMAMATGDIVGVLNSDDVFDGEDALAAVVAHFLAHPQLEAVYGDIRFARGERTVRWYSAAHWRPWMARWGYMVPHPSVYLRRELVGRLGGYALDYEIAADFELMVRYFVRNRVRAGYLPRSVVKMLPGGKSTSGIAAYFKANCENVRALRANGIFSCLPMMLPKYAYKMLGVVFHR